MGEDAAMDAGTPTGAAGAMRARVAALLAAGLDRGALLRELETLAQEPGFAGCADLWAPALTRRGALFFEPFLLRHLDTGHAEVIRALLPEIEAAGHDTLFTGLYRKVADPATWNAELLALAAAPMADTEVARAVTRRDVDPLALNEDVALALYRRNPEQLRAFLRRHIRKLEDGTERPYTQVRDAVLAHGDDDLYWAIFRQVASHDEWEAAVTALLRQRVPADAVAGELRRRQLDHPDGLDGNVLADYVKRYGAAVLPYIQENETWIAASAPESLLEAAHHLDDDGIYWRLFFHVGDPRTWNKALRALADHPPSGDAFAAALWRRTPPASGRTSHWQLDQPIALGLYQHDPAAARPFLERTLKRTDLALYAAAERAHDEELLDYLTTLLLRQGDRLVEAAYPGPITQRWRKPNAQSRADLERIGAAITERLARLGSQSPTDYVRRAANILGRLEPDDITTFKRGVEHNPAFSYLFREQRPVWRRSPEGIRDLLESPNMYAQLVALTALADGDDAEGPEVAQRALENLTTLRALLLGPARRNHKRLALRVLERAARLGGPAAAAIAPVLGEALHYRSKRAIADRVMVSYVRLRHATAER
jgi:hypothetical protein